MYKYNLFAITVTVLLIHQGESFLMKKQMCNSADAMCSPVRCVDAVLDSSGCCLTCPNGENCILFGREIAANHHTVRHLGDCTWICRCPGARAYVENGADTVAVCSMQCPSSNTYLSPQQVSQWYNLRDPLWRKREVKRSEMLRKLAGKGFK